jgi:hypothetical protein
MSRAAPELPVRTGRRREIGGEFQYRIKSSHEGYERVAKESELVVA